MKIHGLSLRPARLTWRQHPAIRTDDELSLGERAADRVRNGMGSWVFVIGAILFLIGWTAGNRDVGFDPYPFILLNLVLSCVAALQGAILLIAARRSDQISAELARHDYETDVHAALEIDQLHEMVTQILRRLDGEEPDAAPPNIDR